MMTKDFQGGMSGISYEFPLRCGSCFRLLKPEAGIVAERYTLDVYPVLLEGASCSSRLKCPCESSLIKNLNTLLAKSEQENECRPVPMQLPALKVVDISCQHKSEIFSNALWCNESCCAVSIGSAIQGSSTGINYVVNEKKLDLAETDDYALESQLPNDGLRKTLLRKSSLHKGSKVLQFFLNQSPSQLNRSRKDETADELGLKTASYRLRRYKRAALYDPWKIVLLFSILSILGTMVLIFLTLRIKQINDNHASI